MPIKTGQNRSKRTFVEARFTSSLRRSSEQEFAPRHFFAIRMLALALLQHSPRD
jgi:hypothetical protein